MGNLSDSVLIVLFGVLILVPYFLPTIVAKMRNKRNKNAIVVLNWVGGWTVIGWIVALVWAFTED